MLFGSGRENLLCSPEEFKFLGYYLIQIKHLLKMLVPSEVYHQKMKIEMTEYIRAKYPGDNS